MPMVFGGTIQIRLFANNDNHPIAGTDFVTFVPEDNAELLLSNYAETTSK
ncbi:unnamed protein product, partial [Rotaria sp. Silwood1]